jgi:hypothetical protein
VARQQELPAAAARRIAAGLRKRLARAVEEAERSASAAGEGEGPAGAGAVGPADAAGRVFEGLGESPGARCEDLWARDRGGVQPGQGGCRAADGSAGIRRARSWAPRVPCDRSSRVRPIAANSQ